MKSVELAVELEGTGPGDTLCPSDMWLEILGDNLARDPDAVHLFAQMMLGVNQEVISGTKGARRVANTVMDLIHEMFVYSRTFPAARRLWILSLEGRLTPDNDPENVLEGAIERGLKETMAARARAVKVSKRSRAKTRSRRAKKLVARRQ